MSMLADVVAAEQSDATLRADVGVSGSKDSKTFGRLVQRIRAEFFDMPGLRLTPSQAARLFGVDADQATRLLNDLAEQGLLVRDTRGAYRRRDAVAKFDTHGWPSHTSGSDSYHHESPAANSSEPVTDLLEQVGVELPCLVCHGSYRISLRKMRLSQLMMDAGCNVRHFADCPPAAFAHLIDPRVLAEFEAAVRRVEAKAEAAGGRLVGPR